MDQQPKTPDLPSPRSPSTPTPQLHHPPNTPPPSYFTTTLGQAPPFPTTSFPQPSTITVLLDSQATHHPTSPALGFVDPGNGHCHQPRKTLYTFRALRDASRAAAAKLRSLVRGQTSVALLGPSTPEVALAWLGLVRGGVAVLLVAPQCRGEAAARLCRACGVEVLVYDGAYEEEAREVERAWGVAGLGVFRVVEIPFAAEELGGVVDGGEEEEDGGVAVGADAVAYYFHTSGTSSGVPKPIPQTHRAAVGVVPRLPSGSGKATFTTTPIYHGGIADCFRSWTSDAPIWLFWARNRPITARNVSKCLDFISTEDPPVKYFSSVPYILQMMASDTRGLKHLQGMDLVGVGGAALPAEAGDALVKQDVNLVSRYGSAECGFLMSSHRDFRSDKEWQYLRNDQAADVLKFERQDDGELSELVVMPKWPHRSKTNRPDGSYATSDLFYPHATIANAWKYHSRADAQLTLITGKKFDPSPMEDAIAASTPLLADVVVFGNEKPFPGALLFRSHEGRGVSDADLIEQVAAKVEDLNAESQDHARIPRNMLVAIGHQNITLEKSSKGTLLRNRAYDAFQPDIEQAYSRLEGDFDGLAADETISEFLQRKVCSILGRKEPPDVDADLFACGVDSVASVQLRYFVKRIIGPDSGEPSMTVVEDAGTIARLSQYIDDRRDGKAEGDGNGRDLKLMRELVQKYRNFAKSIPVGEGVKQQRGGDVVLLTGATGALGAHILALYRTLPTVSKIICLVRGATNASASERVNKSLLARGHLGLDRDEAKVIILQARLGDSNFGLDPDTYKRLKQEVSLIMHVAWAVNFRLGLHSFETDHIAGTANLLSLALSTARESSLAFCSSVASVMQYDFDVGEGVPEVQSVDEADANPTGYGRAKWVAEQLCAQAAQASAKSGDRRPRIAIFRVGQLSGDRKKGIWNRSEAWPLMLGSAIATGCLPDLKDVVLDWLPVDVAAAAIVDISSTLGVDDGLGKDESRLRVYHIVNNSTNATTWKEMLQWVAQAKVIEIVEPGVWLHRLAETGDRHPAQALLPLWTSSYGADATGAGEKEKKAGSRDGRNFLAGSAESASPELSSGQGAVEQDYFMKLWRWIEQNVDGRGE